MEFLFENFPAITWQMIAMWIIGGVLIFLAIKKEMDKRGVDILSGDGYEIRYKTVISKRFDTAAFRAENPWFIDQYTRETISKRFCCVEA